MGCKFSDFNGTCQYFEATESDMRPNGCEPDGACTAADDPDPAWCDSYESDMTCVECGQDLNVKECEHSNQ